MIRMVGCGFFSCAKGTEKVNQDSALPPRKIEEGYVLAVADGVGSNWGSEHASRLTIKLLEESRRSKDVLDVIHFFNVVRTRVSKLGSSGEWGNAATTLTYCFLDSRGLSIGHIGDCRLYVRRGEKLIQVTKDHTQYQHLLDEGIYTERELRGMGKRNVLTSAISADIEAKFDSIYLSYDDLDLANDGFVDVFIMSDGAHHFWELRPRFSSGTMRDPSRFASSLKRRIERLSPVDDYTLVAARFSIGDRSEIRQPSFDLV